MERQMSGTPQIFERHVELSNKHRVSGVYDIWICGPDGEWRHYDKLSGASKTFLQQACAEHGEQVGSTQWDFTDEEFALHIQPILNGDTKSRHTQSIKELGFAQYVES